MPAAETSSGFDFGAVLPYVKASVGEDGERPALTGVDLVSRPLVGSLHVTYVVDLGDHLRYVMGSDLDGHRMAKEELHDLAVRNFGAYVSARGGVQMASRGSIVGLLFDGNFEASFLLLQKPWELMRDRLGASDVVAVAPARDILAFGAAGSAEGRSELGGLVDRVWPTADHRLTRDFYRRADGRLQLASA